VVRVRLRVDLAFGPRAFARGPGVRVRLRVDAPAPAHALALLVCSLWFARSRVFMRAMRVLCSTCAKTALPAPFGAESPGNIGCQSGQIVDVSIRWPRNSGSGSWPKWPGRCSGPGGSAACAGRWRPPRLLSGVPGICVRGRAEAPGRWAAEPLFKKIGAGPAALSSAAAQPSGAGAGGSPGACTMRAPASSLMEGTAPLLRRQRRDAVRDGHPRRCRGCPVPAVGPRGAGRWALARPAGRQRARDACW